MGSRVGNGTEGYYYRAWYGGVLLVLPGVGSDTDSTLIMHLHLHTKLLPSGLLLIRLCVL